MTEYEDYKRPSFRGVVVGGRYVEGSQKAFLALAKNAMSLAVGDAEICSVCPDEDAYRSEAVPPRRSRARLWNRVLQSRHASRRGHLVPDDLLSDEQLGSKGVATCPRCGAPLRGGPATKPAAPDFDAEP
jgi:hypothetical protein